jgi:ABC-type sugar transport system ATPase subunit
MKRLNIQTHPKLAELTCIRKSLVFTKHASERAVEKAIFAPTSIEIQAGEVVEAELSGSRITKLVVRRTMTQDKDLVLVLVPKDSGTWMVVTCWLNDKTDTHRTLKKGRLSA